MRMPLDIFGVVRSYFFDFELPFKPMNGTGETQKIDLQQFFNVNKEIHTWSQTIFLPRIYAKLGARITFDERFIAKLKECTNCSLLPTIFNAQAVSFYNHHIAQFDHDQKKRIMCITTLSLSQMGEFSYACKLVNESRRAADIVTIIFFIVKKHILAKNWDEPSFQDLFSQMRAQVKKIFNLHVDGDEFGDSSIYAAIFYTLGQRNYIQVAIRYLLLEEYDFNQNLSFLFLETLSGCIAHNNISAEKALEYFDDFIGTDLKNSKTNPASISYIYYEENEMLLDLAIIFAQYGKFKDAEIIKSEITNLNTQYLDLVIIYYKYLQGKKEIAEKDFESFRNLQLDFSKISSQVFFDTLDFLKENQLGLNESTESFIRALLVQDVDLREDATEDLVDTLIDKEKYSLASEWLKPPFIHTPDIIEFLQNRIPLEFRANRPDLK